ncbi:hypothetical protein [Pedobacter sp. MR2016-24]|uniref:hypothetical protein n=1 Tax=Pedobacter sp. MR2016-24 TaxID=2994466 RepID=UPI002246DF59|nr:hypothetical protein [Pedobacter sp. MR2016-24]MCX2483466.1 hypothetical protein [Pedobacter sp. MR2016-24]
MNNEKIISADRTQQFISYNFSDLWLKTNNELVYGIIGDEHQRILIKILTALKNPNNPKEYLITGKSSVKENVCTFKGKITIGNIKESKRNNFGINDEFKGESKTQGILTAKYEFFEDKNEKHAGTFYGVVKTKWYLDNSNIIVYDDIDITSDGYFNNAFVGLWKIYEGKVIKKCNWADYRVPSSNCDFDIGAEHFNVSKKYWRNGWLDVALKNKMQDPVIIENKGAAINFWWL